jgi:hypothetical protein
MPELLVASSAYILPSLVGWVSAITTWKMREASEHTGRILVDVAYLAERLY